jgi:hypothetical protein
MPRAPQKPAEEDRPPETIWAWERRRRGLDETQPISDEVPKLPATSPWAAGIDQVSGPEPAVDRSCDGTFITPEES